MNEISQEEKIKKLEATLAPLPKPEEQEEFPSPPPTSFRPTPALVTFFSKIRNKGKLFLEENLSVFGLDIGSRSVKLVRTRQSKKKNCLRDYVFKETFSYSPSKKRELADVLNEVKSELQLARYNVKLVISEDVILHTLTLPVLSPKDTQNMVVTELKKILPWELDKALFKYYVLGKAAGRENRVNILVCILQKESLNKRLAFLQGLGFYVRQCIPIHFIFEEMIARMGLLKPQETAGLLLCGANSTLILVLEGERLLYSREIKIGGEQINQALLRPLITTNRGTVVLGPDQAEELKRTFGLPEPEKKIEIFELQIDGQQLYNLIKPILDRWVTEIKRSLDYVSTNFNLARPKTLLMAGAGAKLIGLDVFLAKELQIKIDKLDPLGCINWIDPHAGERRILEELSLELSAAIGASLVTHTNKDFLPAEFKRSRRLDKITFVMHFIGPVSVIIFLILCFFTQISAIRFQFLIRKTKTSLAALQSTLDKINYYVEQKKRVVENEALVRNAIGRQPRWGGILREISQITPEGISLSDLFLTKDTTGQKKLYFKGMIQETILPVDMLLSQFMVALNNSCFFTKVELISTTKEKEKEGLAKSKFEIAAQLVY